MSELSHDLTRPRGRRAANNHNQLPTTTEASTLNTNQLFATQKLKIEHTTVNTDEQPIPRERHQATEATNRHRNLHQPHPKPSTTADLR
jgi:hypothetical protein